MIFRYIKGTLEFGLWFPKTKYFTLTAYTNADWLGSEDDKKSTSGGAFYLGMVLVSWLSKEKTSIFISTTEEECISTASCCTQVIWMEQNLEDVQVKYDHPINIKCYNTNSINISKNPIMYSKTNQIQIKYYFMRD
jgi:hypothetical protein